MEWNVADPNLLSLKFDAEEGEEAGEERRGSEGGGGAAPPGTPRRRAARRGAVRIRVTKRSEKAVAEDRLDTSEFSQMIFLNDNDGGENGGVPRVKGSQVFSKWKWRSADESGSGGGARGPTVVATQVVSEFLSVEAGGERAYLESGGRPIAVYTYRLALTRV